MIHSRRGNKRGIALSYEMHWQALEGLQEAWTQKRGEKIRREITELSYLAYKWVWTQETQKVLIWLKMEKGLGRSFQLVFTAFHKPWSTSQILILITWSFKGRSGVAGYELPPVQWLWWEGNGRVIIGWGPRGMVFFLSFCWVVITPIPGEIYGWNGHFGGTLWQ
jgi:hypothetical protein